MKPLLIGLSGKSGSGKSTLGDYLEREHGYMQFAFADALKDVVQTAFRFTDEQMIFGKEDFDPRCGISPRWCLQHFGSAFREVWPEIWIWNLRREILNFLGDNGQHPIVITDVRFYNEMEALKRLGAVLVRIERPKKNRPTAYINGIPGHVSETDLDGREGWGLRGNHVIYNIETLNDLYRRLEIVLALEAAKADSVQVFG